MSAHCAPTAPNPDRMIYFVLCRYDSGLAWAEREVSDTDRASTIHDIRSGELRNVVQVIELNHAEFTSRDVTEDILAECVVANFIAIGARLFSDQIAYDRDHARDYRKHEVV
jgi:hypothetical protein